MGLWGDLTLLGTPTRLGSQELNTTSQSQDPKPRDVRAELALPRGPCFLGTRRSVTASGPTRNHCNSENNCSFETWQVLWASETLVFSSLRPGNLTEALPIRELHPYLCEMVQKWHTVLPTKKANECSAFNWTNEREKNIRVACIGRQFMEVPWESSRPGFRDPRQYDSLPLTN